MSTLAANAATSSETTPRNAIDSDKDDDCGLENVLFGEGRWTSVRTNDKNESVQEDTTASRKDGATTAIPPPPANFVTYAVRFLIRYDEGASSWWASQERATSLLPTNERQAKLGKLFGCLARSLQIGIANEEEQQQYLSVGRYSTLAQLFLDRYAQSGDNDADIEARRHIGLLFAMLPPEQQPTSVLQTIATGSGSKQRGNGGDGIVDAENDRSFDDKEVLSFTKVPLDVVSPPPRQLQEDLTALLPSEYKCVKATMAAAATATASTFFTITPAISLYQVGIDEEFGQTATATAMGPLASTPLQREQPRFSWNTYKLLAVSGAASCALTHTLVVPLDVVKTRMQTTATVAATTTNTRKAAIAGVGTSGNANVDLVAVADSNNNNNNNMIQTGVRIWQEEGPSGLLLGTQATIVGYCWYGLSVYPSYTFLKQFLSSALPPELATIHTNDVALVAGALAAVVASIGLTPMEACRIRTVAEPNIYQSQGVWGTLRSIASEGNNGLQTVYAGLPSLLTRQVIFGSVKFLAYERACEAIYATWPILHDSTWTSLAVSLVAGGLSGCLSSVVSQPADSVLTYTARTAGGNNKNRDLLQGCRDMVAKEGLGSLFRGLGSRCVWAGSIIAGQFLLYDAFRTWIHISGPDLVQVYEVAIFDQR